MVADSFHNASRALRLLSGPFFLLLCAVSSLVRAELLPVKTYTTDDGLPHRLVTDFLETRNGAYWVATSDGLARFNPRDKRGLSIRDSQ